jgi:hypothetical protein
MPIIGLLVVVGFVYTKFFDKDPKPSKWKSFIPLIGWRYIDHEKGTYLIYHLYQVTMFLLAMYLVWTT